MLIAALLFAAQLVADDPQDLARFGSLPRDVSAFVDRRLACNHFAGEFNGDRSARDREVNRKMRELRCGVLERDEARLQRRHAQNAKVLEALSATRDWQ